MNDSERQRTYVEVVAEASYDEPIERFVADVELEVRGASEDSALKQVTDLSARCVERLRGAGLAPDEVEDAGLNVQRPWWFSRKQEVGKTASHTLRVRCGELTRLHRALMALEGVTANQRETIGVRMAQPVFQSDDARQTAALRAAVAAARQKAKAVAEEAGGTLGPLLRVVEGPQAKRNSGFAGDGDWDGDSGRFAGMAGAVRMGEVAEGGDETPLSTPSRTIWVYCRARFEIQYPASR